tara:strand:+ start:31 stop:564 length:534 start_codon:yes stop_codon:yes gene_type:complete
VGSFILEKAFKVLNVVEALQENGIDGLEEAGMSSERIEAYKDRHEKLLVEAIDMARRDLFEFDSPEGKLPWYSSLHRGYCAIHVRDDLKPVQAMELSVAMLAAGRSEEEVMAFREEMSDKGMAYVQRMEETLSSPGPDNDLGIDEEDISIIRKRLRGLRNPECKTEYEVMSLDERDI